MFLLKTRAPALSTPSQLASYSPDEVSTGCSSAVTSPTETSSFTETSVSEVSSTLLSTIDALGTYAADIPAFTGHLYLNEYGGVEYYLVPDDSLSDEWELFVINTDSGASLGYLELMHRVPMGDGGSLIDVVMGIYSTQYIFDNAGVAKDYQTYCLQGDYSVDTIPLPVMWTSEGGVAIDKSSLVKAGLSSTDKRDTFWMCTDAQYNYVYVYSSVGLDSFLGKQAGACTTFSQFLPYKATTTTLGRRSEITPPPVLDSERD
ncbi:hypothetical protein TWF718_002924 [Orbilia javanica]|uniref:Uncharacterized protein n=1 Tax=Orbilia javanica TaxID=47235 RepID=A0AAN8R856_9PEZI